MGGLFGKKKKKKRGTSTGPKYNQGAIMGGMMNQGGNPPPQDVKNINFQDKSHNPNATRSRLQKKLKEKKVNVEKLNN